MKMSWLSYNSVRWAHHFTSVKTDVKWIKTTTRQLSHCCYY